MPNRPASKDLTEVILDGVAQSLADVHTAMPGVIVKYDRSTNLAEVQPQLKRKFVSVPEATALPVIAEVPVLQLRAASSFIRLPIKAGDPGLILFSERSIDVWMERGETVDPLDRRRFSLSDAMFLPALFPKTKPLPTTGATGSMVISNNGLVLELTQGGKIKIQNDAGELLSALSTLLTSLAAEPFIVNKATITQVKAVVDGLKGD